MTRFSGKILIWVIASIVAIIGLFYFLKPLEMELLDGYGIIYRCNGVVLKNHTSSAICIGFKKGLNLL